MDDVRWHVIKYSSTFIQLQEKKRLFGKLTNLDDSIVVMSILHARFVEHFPMKVFRVGIDDFQVVIALCRDSVEGNLVDFRFRIVIIVHWIEQRR